MAISYVSLLADSIREEGKNEMKALQKFVDGKNQFAKIFDQEPIDLSKLDDAMAQKIFDMLDGDLSPENLHCDGEITPTQARRKAKVLYNAGNDLLKAGYKPKSQYSEFNS